MLPPVVPGVVGNGHGDLGLLLGLLAREHTSVPQLDRLVLAVGYQVPAVPTRIHVGYAAHVAGQDAHRLGIVLAQFSPVPDLRNRIFVDVLASWPIKWGSDIFRDRLTLHKPSSPAL